MLEVSEVVKRVRGLVSSRTIVVVEGAVRAFLVNFQPNLVGCLNSFSFLC